MSARPEDYAAIAGDVADLGDLFFDGVAVETMTGRDYDVGDITGEVVAHLVQAVSQRFGVRPEVLYSRALQASQSYHTPAGGWREHELKVVAHGFRKPLRQPWETAAAEAQAGETALKDPGGPG